MRVDHRVLAFVSLTVGLASGLATVPGCGGSSGPALSAAEQDKMQAHERLQGRWRLDSFTPSAPLGPPLDSLLAAQIGQLVLDVDPTQLAVTGAGVDTTRRYEVLNATPLGANVQLIDEAGVRFDIEVRFRGDAIDFSSKTSPWEGRGSLSREP